MQPRGARLAAIVLAAVALVGPVSAASARPAQPPRPPLPLTDRTPMWAAGRRAAVVVEGRRAAAYDLRRRRWRVLSDAGRFRTGTVTAIGSTVVRIGSTCIECRDEAELPMVVLTDDLTGARPPTRSVLSGTRFAAIAGVDLIGTVGSRIYVATGHADSRDQVFAVDLTDRGAQATRIPRPATLTWRTCIGRSGTLTALTLRAGVDPRRPEHFRPTIGPTGNSHLEEMTTPGPRSRWTPVPEPTDATSSAPDASSACRVGLPMLVTETAIWSWTGEAWSSGPPLPVRDPVHTTPSGAIVARSSAATVVRSTATGFESLTVPGATPMTTTRIATVGEQIVALISPPDRPTRLVLVA